MTDQAAQVFNQLFERYPSLTICKHTIEQSFYILKRCYDQKGKVLVCGNGGSASDAEHIVGELMKGFMLKRKVDRSIFKTIETFSTQDAEYLLNHLQHALPAISLVSQTALITAFANDVSPEMIFAQQVFAYAQPSDVLIAISTSGSSMNIVRAVQTAKICGIMAIGMTGENGRTVKDLCDVTICAPATTAFATQEYHLPIYHTLCAMLELEFFN